MATGVLKDEISKELDDFISKVEEGGTVDQSVLKFIKRVKDNIVKFQFDASGNLMQSITPLPTSVNGNIVKITIEIEDYWKDLEEGTKPKGFTKEKRKSLQPRILDWINNKPELQKIANTQEERRSLSYAIATNILKNGTIKRFGYKGKKFLTIEIPQLEIDIAKDYQP
jgi:hypothetical protein